MERQLALITLFLAITGCTSSMPNQPHAANGNDARLAAGRWVRGDVLYRDTFNAGLEQWSAELEKGGVVQAIDNRLEIDVPAGCTAWFMPELEGPVLIEFTATVVGDGGPNDRVSDLNCFWMARDARSPDDLFATRRSGAFADYDQLRCYYVGYGGNANSTTRFRRYIGQQDRRPLLPEHDLSDEAFLITPNSAMTIQLVAAGPRIEYWRDGELLFELDDPEPYTRGWFAVRTVHSHLLIEHFTVTQLVASPGK